MIKANNKWRCLLVPAVAIFALSACDSPTMISKGDVAHNYQPADLWRFSGGDNALQVDGYGSPFGDSQKRVDDAVVAAMQGHNGGPRVTFSTAKAPPPKPTWRVVMALNPTELRDTEQLCKLTDPPKTAPSQGGKLRVLAAFCEGDWTASQATASGSDINSLDSPKFDTLVADLTNTLFPAADLHERFDRRCIGTPCQG